MTISITASGFFSWSWREMPESWRSCCHSLGRPVNSPVDELKPTWVRWTGSYGVLISIRLELFRKSDMKLNIPFLDFVVVPLRERPVVPWLAEERVGVGGMG